MKLTRTLALAVPFALALSGCPEDTPLGDGGPGDGSLFMPPNSGPGASGLTDSFAFPLDRTPDPTCTGIWMEALKARIVNDDLTPPAMARPNMCVKPVAGEFQCLEGVPADANGVFEVQLNPEARCLEWFAVRAVADLYNSAISYCKPDPSQVQNSVLVLPENIVTYRAELPTNTPAPPSTAPQTFEYANGVRLTVVGNSVVYAEDFAQLKSVAPGLDAPLCFIDGTEGYAGLVGFAPEQNEFLGVEPGSRTGVDVSLPNESQLAEGTRVEFYVLGALGTLTLDGREIAEGVWGSVGTGQVTGGKVVNDPGSKIPALTWLAYKPL